MNKVAQELKEAREELERFFSPSLDLLCIADLDGFLRRVNPAWQEVLGWTPADLEATPYLEFVHPDDRAVTAAEAGKLGPAPRRSASRTAIAAKMVHIGG